MASTPISTPTPGIDDEHERSGIDGARAVTGVERVRRGE